MALIKFGGGITAMSGSIAGNTFAHNRSGYYSRSRTKPVNPNSAGQQAIRTALSQLTTIWATVLTAGQRTAWATYAASVAMKNRLGETIYLTGFNHFLRSNIDFLNNYDQYAAAGPTTLSLPAKDTQFAVAGSVATQLISITFDATAAWCSEALATFNVYQGQPRKATENFFAGPWKKAGAIIGNAGAPPASPQTLSAPYTLVLGQLVSCYARIRRADGRLSEAFSASFTVGA